MADHSSGSRTRPSLLLRLRDPRDAASWGLFREIYGTLVYRYCQRRGLQPADAEDVTQRVFAAVFRAISTFEYRTERGRFRDWLGELTRHELSRFWASRKRQDEVEKAGDPGALEATQAPGQETEWSEECERHILQTALARTRPHFDELTWRAFERTWLDTRPPIEAARELGQGIDWVYVAKSRVLQRLRQEVQELSDDTGLFPG
jgi:RNA polymerase sigma-70 factor, ECF subfamily